MEARECNVAVGNCVRRRLLRGCDFLSLNPGMKRSTNTRSRGKRRAAYKYLDCIRKYSMQILFKIHILSSFENSRLFSEILS